MMPQQESPQTIIRRTGTLSEIGRRTLLEDLLLIPPEMKYKPVLPVHKTQRPAIESAMELLPSIIGRVTSGDLAKGKGVSKNTIYNHLQLLIGKGLVKARRERGKVVYWRL